MNQICPERSKKYFSQLMKRSREENILSIETLKKQGIKLIAPPSEKDMQKFYEHGKEARRMMVNKLYSLELVEEVEKALIEFRKNKKQQ